MAIRRKVAHLQLEKAFFVPKFGELKGRTLNTEFYPGISMLMGDYGVDCTLEYGGKKTEFFIPFAKIEVAVYVQAERKEDPTHVKAA